MADDIDTVGKATTLLGLLGERADGATLSQLSRASGYPLSSAHRLLASLRRDGFVAFDETSKRYGLGLRLFALGAAVSAARGFSTAALPVVRELSAATGESALMAVLDGDRQLCVHHLEAGAAVGVRGETGRRGPLHATAGGKALLAFAGHSVREGLLETVPLERFTPRTTTSREALRREVAAVGAQGYAVADEEHELGVRAIGVPVLGAAGSAVAALAVASPAYRTTVPGALRFLPALREAADRLAVLLPHR